MSFLGDFKAYLATRTDCPPDFHYHAGMVALATALGNRAYCHGWTRPIYANIWSIIIADSGYGKSAPPDLCETVLRKAGLGGTLLPPSFSQEVLYTVLKDQPVGTFILQEFSAFLGMLGKEYNAGCTQFLTEVYDCPPEVRRLTFKHGDIVIPKPCMSILGASSPSWFEESFKAKDLSGGFLARFLFCPSNDAGAPVDDPGPPDDAIESVLADHLRRVASLGSDERPLLADFSAVQATFSAWDRDYRQKLRKDCPREFSGMRSRAGLMVKKAAMLFSVSRDPSRLVISKQDLDYAIRFVTYTHGQAEKFLTEQVARDADEADRIKILDILRRSNGRAAWSDVLHASRMRADKFARAVETLKQSGRLLVLKGPGPNGRDVQWLEIAGARLEVVA